LQGIKPGQSLGCWRCNGARAHKIEQYFHGTRLAVRSGLPAPICPLS